MDTTHFVCRQYCSAFTRNVRRARWLESVGWQVIALILAAAKLLLPLIPTAEQRAAGQQAIADNYIKFLNTTDSSLYAAIRSLEILGALWDVFFNGGRMWAQASAALVSSPFGVVELLILLWPFFGNSLSAFAVQALQKGLSDISSVVSKGPVARPAQQATNDSGSHE